MRLFNSRRIAAFAAFHALPALASNVTLSPGGNDSANFNNAAFKCTSGGGTITINAGIYTVSNLVMPSNCTIKGVGNPVLKAASPGTPVFSQFWANVSNTTVQGITIDGGGIYGNTFTNFNFINNTVQNIPAAGCCSDGLHVAAVNNVTVRNNTFFNIGANCFPTPPQGGPDECNSAVGAYGGNNYVVDSNVFDTVEEGVKGYQVPNPPLSTNIQVTSNTFLRVHRMAIEFQWQFNNGVFSGNAFSNWINPFWISTCISIASQGTVAITNNVCDGSFSQGGAGYFGMCIENMANASITGNTCEFNASTPANWRWGAWVASYPWNTAGSLITGNNFCGAGGGLTGLPNLRTGVGINSASPSCVGLYVQPQAGP